MLGGKGGEEAPREHLPALSRPDLSFPAELHDARVRHWPTRFTWWSIVATLSEAQRFQARDGAYMYASYRHSRNHEVAAQGQGAVTTSYRLPRSGSSQKRFILQRAARQGGGGVAGGVPWSGLEAIESPFDAAAGQHGGRARVAAPKRHHRLTRRHPSKQQQYLRRSPSPCLPHSHRPAGLSSGTKHRSGPPPMEHGEIDLGI